VAAGRGRLDYDLYIQLLLASGYHGALLLHSLGEDEVSASVAFLRAGLQRARSRARE
jgi:sugar phosphate isomerase/epimerase